MNVRSHNLSPSVACRIGVLCSAVLVSSLYPAQAQTEGEAPAAGAWWAFQQRAYPLSDIPDGAQMRALRQTHAARAARPSTAGGGGAGSDRWINIGPAPLLGGQSVRPVSGRVSSVAR